MDNNIYKVDLTKATKEKTYYSLAMFPYPSGAGLHVGHGTNFTANDVVARFKRMQGYTVINPIGWDSFGLPTENYAMKLGRSASEVTAENIANYKKQCELMDWSYDWDREVTTSSPEYYKWTQWIFQQLFKAGLVYKKDAFVNRCPSCQTVLANDQVVDGRCERCDTEIIQKKHPQRFIKITDYADRLINDLDLVDRPEETKTQQKYWIGKSEGAEIDFAVDGGTEKITVFTTRPDTLFGVTALVLAPENASIDAYIPAEYKSAIEEYRIATSKKTAIERQADAETKSGVFSGVYAIHPLTQQKVPVRFADYVLPDYATGAVMFVPAHDERDWAFAQKHGLEIKDVVAQHYISGNAPIPGKENTLRKNVLAMLYNQDMTKIACLDWSKSQQWKSFIMGGIEEGESIEEAGRREIIEESGYTDLEYIDTVAGEVHAEYYAAHKDVNRYSKEYCQIFRLKTQDNNGNTEGSEDHDLVRIPAEEVEKFLSDTPGEYNSNLIYFLRHTAKNQAYTGNGRLINSAQFDGLDNQEAKKAITQYLEEKGLGKAKTTYKLRDWSVSRQRYWGSPIPVYYTFDNNEEVPYFRYTDAVRGVKEGVVTKPRETVQAIIKDVNTNKYLMLERKIDGMRSFVGGGVEEGESLEQAILKEISEEAGFDKIVSIKIHGKEVHREFYHALKGYNQYTTTQCFVVEVDTKDQKEISADEKEKHEPVWMTAEEILAQRENIDADNIYSFELYLGHNIDAPAYTPRYNAYNPHPDKDMRVPHLIPEDQLPVVLPLDLGDYKPAGKSPLADHPTFPHYHAPDGKVYLRECDTLDTFMCSSFYYLRFIDPTNTKELISKEFADKALPVDFYIGGKEHTYGHLLYSRFIHKFLFDQGVVPSAEPFQKLFHQGMVLGPDGRKMSKRRGNVITPGDLVEKYGTDMGADVLRTYTMFMGPLEVEKAWNDNAVDGVKRFLDRVARVMDFVGKGEASNPSNDKNSITYQTTIQLHKTIKGVTEDIEKLKFNTAISKLMVFVNHIYDVKQITKEHFSTFLQLLAPFATKLTQKLWTELGNTTLIHTSIWPTYDDSYLAEDSMDLPVQINGKMRGTLHIKKGLTQDEIINLIQQDEKISSHLGDIIANPPKKIIFVQDKIINIIL